MGGAPLQHVVYEGGSNMARLKGILVSFVAACAVAVMVLSAYLLLSGRYAIVSTGSSNGGILASATSLRRLHLQNRDFFVRSSQRETFVNDFEDALEKLLNLDSKGPRREFDRVIALSSLLPPISNISRIPTPAPEFFLQYIAPVGLPVIFTDMLVGTSLDNWSWEMVRERWGERMYSNTRQGNYSSRVNRFGKHYISRVSIRLKDFIDVVTGRRAPNSREKGLYITKQRVIPQDQLNQLFYYPPFYPGDHSRCYLEPTGWIGAPGTFTQGHIDSKDNFVYQLLGEKRWTIFPPRDYKRLYYRREKGSLEWSAVLSQTGQPDLEKYPLFRETHPITFIMRPGEVLYLPRGWTHFVENITPSLMLNTWRRGPAGILELWFPKSRNGIRKACF